MSKKIAVFRVWPVVLFLLIFTSAQAAEEYEKDSYKPLYEIPAVSSCRLTGQVMTTKPSYFRNLPNQRIRTRGGEHKEHDWVSFPHYRIDDVSSPVSLKFEASLLKGGGGYLIVVLGSKTPYEMGPPKPGGDGIGFLAVCLEPNGTLSLRDHADGLNPIGEPVQLECRDEVSDFEVTVDIVPQEGDRAGLKVTSEGKYQGTCTFPALPAARFRGYPGIGADLFAEWEFWNLRIRPGKNQRVPHPVLERTVRFARYTLERQGDGTVAPRIQVCLDRPNGSPLVVKVKSWGASDNRYAREQTWKDVISGEDGSQEMSRQGPYELEGFATFTHLVTEVDCRRENVNVGVFRDGAKLIEFEIKDKWPAPGEKGSIMWMGALQHSLVTRYTWPLTHGRPRTRGPWKLKGTYAVTGEPMTRYLFAEEWTPTLTPTGTDWGLSNIFGHRALALIVGDDAYYPEGRSLPRTCQDNEWEAFLVWGLCRDLHRFCLTTPVYWKAGDHDRNVDDGYHSRGFVRGSGPPEYPWPAYYNEQVRRLYSAGNPNSLDGGDGTFWVEVGELALVICEDSRFNNSAVPPQPTMDDNYTACGIHVLRRMDKVYRKASQHFLFSHGDFSLADVWNDKNQTLYYYRAEQKRQLSWHCDCQMARIIGDRHSSAYIYYSDFSGMTGVSAKEFAAFEDIYVPEAMIGTVRQDFFRGVNESGKTGDGAVFVREKFLHGMMNFPPLPELWWKYLTYLTTELDPATDTIAFKRWHCCKDLSDPAQPAYVIKKPRHELGYQQKLSRLPPIRVRYADGRPAEFIVVRIFDSKGNNLITTRRTDKDGSLPPLATRFDRDTELLVKIVSPGKKVFEHKVKIGSKKEVVISID